METYIRQRQLIMSPLITSHVIGENEPLTSVLNKVIAAKEVNHKGQGTHPCALSWEGTCGGSTGAVSLDCRSFSLPFSDAEQTLLGTAPCSFLLNAFNTEELRGCTQHGFGSQLCFVNSVEQIFIPGALSQFCLPYNPNADSS